MSQTQRDACRMPLEEPRQRQAQVAAAVSKFGRSASAAQANSIGSTSGWSFTEGGLLGRLTGSRGLFGQNAHRHTDSVRSQPVLQHGVFVAAAHARSQHDVGCPFAPQTASQTPAKQTRNGWVSSSPIMTSRISMKAVS